jgi:hypothetical protein
VVTESLELPVASDAGATAGRDQIRHEPRMVIEYVLFSPEPTGLVPGAAAPQRLRIDLLVRGEAVQLGVVMNLFGGV